MKLSSQRLLWLALALLALPAPWLQGAEPEVVLSELDNPCAVAIQPETGTLFISDSAAGRVVRVVDGKAQDVIVGFPQDVYGKGPKYNIGPLGLAFLNQNTLVVGGGGLEDGKELLRVYEIPEAGGEAIQADNMKASFSLEATDDIKGEGNFYALAISDAGIFATSNGDDTKGWVARATVEDGEVKNYERFIATKEAVMVDAPVGVTISPRGEVVIGQMGEITIPGDSLLTFYNAKTGKMLANFETGLSDITALAYSADGSALYALDFAWFDTSEGGLFKLVAQREDGKQTVKTVKIAELDKPTAMVYSEKDKALYVTVIGSAEEGKKTGQLLRFKDL